ncbi:MAG: Cache 3/Cache 2 fusion domain-containing protein [Bacteroidales bacterium]|nr:Cache 3/Cache 2 fusion domain-containing protein [Bacteroidales bacterium]MCF8455815.1 Cache 3/Cache 2 fusion domain-containing protein [Bacteroidales bacterium]
MAKPFEHIKIKLKLFYPIFLGMMVAIVALSMVSINKVKENIHQTTVDNLKLELKTVKSMFEREQALKLEKVKYDMRVAHNLFYRRDFGFSGDSLLIQVTNQITHSKHEVYIPTLYLNSAPVYKNYQLVDRISYLSGGTATLFQKIDSGYVRLSTNVQQSDGSRAINTFIPNNSPVIQTIERGETYMGRAFVVNEWYITAYEPIIIDGKVQAILYVGDKEKDISDLQAALQKLRIGESGYIFVFDKSKELVVAPPDELHLIETPGVLDSIVSLCEGNLIFKSNTSSTERIVAFSYFEEFDLYMAASIDREEVEANQVDNIMHNAGYSALIILILFSIYVFLITTKRVQKFLNALQESGQKLKSARVALQHSEENFKTLFNNTSDEIFVTAIDGKFIFVNQQACDTLGYSLDEFDQMRMEDIKSDRYRDGVQKNRELLFEKGEMVFESEHKTKTDEIIPVELKSRVIEINNQKAILSISRNMAQRKEMERKLLSVVIQTEERERERFSKDMHDGLGPLLSTIKLYVNELEGDELQKTEKKQYIKYLNELIDEAVTSTRTISNNLMPRVIHEYGLVKALESFCRKVNKTNKILIDFKAEGIEEDLDQNIQIILFRVVNELINNTLKHAQAKNILIQLSKTDKHIHLYFKDDGIGFDVDEVMERRKAGIGLKNILGRISSINGRSSIQSQVGAGVKVDIEIDV